MIWGETDIVKKLDIPTKLIVVELGMLANMKLAVAPKACSIGREASPVVVRVCEGDVRVMLANIGELGLLLGEAVLL